MFVNLIDFGAENLPCRKHPGDFGADIYAPKDYTIKPHTCVDILVGWGIEVPNGYGGYIEPRGSMGNIGLLPVSNPIDSNFRGEVHAVMWNVSDKVITINKGDRFAQLVIRAGDISSFSCIKPEQATATDRGDGHFGSTGR